MFYLNSTLNFGIPPVLVFQLEVYYKVDRLLTGLTAQPKGTTARWYSNKTSLHLVYTRYNEVKGLFFHILFILIMSIFSYIFLIADFSCSFIWFFILLEGGSNTMEVYDREAQIRLRLTIAAS